MTATTFLFNLLSVDSGQCSILLFQIVPTQNFLLFKYLISGRLVKKLSNASLKLNCGVKIVNSCNTTLAPKPEVLCTSEIAVVALR